MELSNFNNYNNHQQTNEICKQKYPTNDLEIINTAMPRKDEDFIEYIRDLIDPQPVDATTTTTTPTPNNLDNKATTFNGTNFHNTLFHFVNKDGQYQSVDTIQNDAEIPEPLDATNAADLSMQVTTNNSTYKQVTNYLSEDFISSTSARKSFCDSNTPTHENTFPSLTLLTEDNSVFNNDDIFFCTSQSTNARKVLPHKKRISRKLKVSSENLLPSSSPPPHPHPIHKEEKHLNEAKSLQFSCEICGHSTVSQLQFFAHLKQHYEPVDTTEILNSNTNNICVIEKKTDKICNDDNVVNDAFDNVPLNFHNDYNDVGSPGPIPTVIEQAVSDNELTTTQHISPQNAVVEFSDSEDMLEGIRNVVDKVSIEDSCDNMELIHNNHIRSTPLWYRNNYNRPYNNVEYNEPLTQILQNPNSVEVIVPHDNDLTSHTNTDSIGERESVPIETNELDQPIYPTQQQCDQKVDKNFYESNPIDSNVIVRCERISESEDHDVKVFDIELTDYKMQTNVDSEKSENNIMKDGNGKKIKKFICTECDREFNSHNSLKYHKRVHTGIRPHNCDECDKSFYTLSVLKAHRSVHSGEKPHQCPECERKFRQWGDLRHHIISVHTDEKSYQCEYCGKSFARKYSLVLHRRIHTCERNYICEFCQKTFRASTYLSSHMKIHTGERSYECDKCHKRFRLSADRRRHQRRVHQKKKDNIDDNDVNFNCNRVEI